MVAVSMVSLVLLTVAADPSARALPVTGATACPLPADVEAALSGLIPARDPELPPDVAELKDDTGSVVVILRRGAGEPIGEKRLDPGLSCAQRAREAAVIIAAWEAHFTTPAAALEIEARTAGARPPVVVVGAAPPPAMVVPQTENVVELGVSAGGSINGTTRAPAAAIEIAYARAFARVVPALAALFVGGHTTSVGPGRATWRRYGLVATAASRREWRPVWAEGHLGVALTLLDIAGSSFPNNGSGVTFDPGLDFGARVGLRSHRMRWWLDGTVALWPRAQDVYVQGVPGSSTLPRGQALFSLGAAYEIR
jgi:hypothetical protein